MIWHRFLFVQLESVDDAKAVVKNLNGYALDKAHTLIANFFADFERFLAVPDEYVPPKKEEFKQKVYRVICVTYSVGTFKRLVN